MAEAGPVVLEASKIPIAGDLDRVLPLVAGPLIATDEELGGAPSEGVDVASSSFPSIMNRGLSNQ